MPELLLSVDRVVPHTDADGLAAGALALRARREGTDAAVLLGRRETPFGPDAPLPPGSAAVLDWACGASSVLAQSVRAKPPYLPA